MGGLGTQFGFKGGVHTSDAVLSGEDSPSFSGACNCLSPAATAASPQVILVLPSLLAALCLGHPLEPLIL